MTDSTNGDDGADEPTCTACGDTISEVDLRRIATKVVDGRVVAVQFCDEDCLDDWQTAGELEAWYSTDA